MLAEIKSRRWGSQLMASRACVCTCFSHCPAHQLARSVSTPSCLRLMPCTPWDQSSEPNISLNGDTWETLGTCLREDWVSGISLGGADGVGVLRSACELGRQHGSPCPVNPRVARYPWGEGLPPNRSSLFALHSAGDPAGCGSERKPSGEPECSFSCTCWMPPQSNWFCEWSAWNVLVTALTALSLFSSGLAYTLWMVLWRGWQLSLPAEKSIKLLQVFGKWFQ